MIDKYLTADIVDNEPLFVLVEGNEEVKVDMSEVVVVGGSDGEDGFSPIVSLEKVGKISTLEITDKNGVHKTQIFDGNDGKNGIDGENGKDGVGISSVKQTTTSSSDNGINTITVTLSNGTKSTFNVRNGSKGSVGEKGEKGDKGAQGSKGDKGDKGDAGAKGADGYTPIKNVDYFTSEDKAELVNDVIASLPTWNGGSY